MRYTYSNILKIMVIVSGFIAVNVFGQGYYQQQCMIPYGQKGTPMKFCCRWLCDTGSFNGPQPAGKQACNATWAGKAVWIPKAFDGKCSEYTVGMCSELYTDVYLGPKSLEPISKYIKSKGCAFQS